MIRIAILDDYQRVALTMADWSGLPPECEPVVFDRNLAIEDEAARALADFDVVCLLRERMPMPRVGKFTTRRKAESLCGLSISCR